AVLRDLHEAVVGADVEETLLLRRFRERDDVPEEGRADVLARRVGAPDAFHDGQRVAVEAPREVPARGAPGAAAVLRDVEPLRREVEARALVRADEERRIPVPARGVLALLRLRLDGELLARPPVEALEDAVLRLGVDDVRVVGIGERDEAVALLEE